MAKLTPMMRQFKETKEKYKEAILFFRVGDFYEMFFDDAITASRELDITLTSRDGNKEDAVPLAGFPHHAASGYIARLLERGYKVAICEQVEDPAQAQGLVKREVVRVITPGTHLEDNLLEEDRNNYLASICHSGNKEEYGLAVADVSTGEIMVFCFTGQEAESEVRDELSRLQPSEILLIPAVKNSLSGGRAFPSLLKERDATINYGKPFANREEALNFFREECPYLRESAETINSSSAFFAVAAALRYIKEMQKAPMQYFQQARLIEKNETMFLDGVTLRNLEVFVTIRSQDKEGTLFGILNRTRTSLGGRQLRKWLQRPLLDRDLLSFRWEAVEELKNNPFYRGEIKKLLRDVCDLERFCGRLNLGRVDPGGMLSLKKTLQLLPGIKEILKETSAGLFKKMVEEVPDFTYLAEELERAINEDASFSMKEGNIFKPGYSEEADRLRKVSSESKTWMLEMEKTERERTGIRTLKIGFNKVFGYYLEVTKSYQERVPQNYIRKQTLANAERYITQELKEKEDLILRAEERLAQLESTLFQELCQKVAGYTPELQFLAGQMATLDCIFSFADVASANNYTKPCFSEDGSIKISGCRHPVVEQKGEDLFVPNDVLLDENKERIHIITGPNMAGKSTYCRSVALSLIMAQAGSFVPATTMSFMPLGRIFARVGASDDLSRGRSTFMVEMEETASILTGAANDCLIVLDEIGRGTSTFDGMSLARAILEYLHGRTGARVLFSTHYHELTALEKQLAGVKNYTVSVREEGDSIIFLRKVVPGKANRSYGINVARMAGLPREVLEQAQKFLNELEKTDSDQVLSLAENRSDDRVPSANRLQEKKGQLSLFPEVDRQVKPFTLKEQKIIEEIKALNLIKVTPLDALLKLFSLQKRLSSQALRQERDG